MSYQQISDRLIPVKQYVTPTTGSTVTVNGNGYIKLVINPAGSLVALTVTLPGSPSDGDTVNLSCTQAVTTLTMNGGTIVGGLATLSIGSTATYIYNSDSSQWIKSSS